MSLRQRRQVGTLIVLVGVVAALIAALADPLGIGGEDGFGWKQGVLLAIGIVLIIAGGAIVWLSQHRTEVPPAQ
jgi:hypothetical protein